MNTETLLPLAHTIDQIHHPATPTSPCLRNPSQNSPSLGNPGFRRLVETHSAVASQNSERIRRLQQHISTLLDGAVPDPGIILEIDQEGQILNSVGNATAYLTRHFKSGGVDHLSDTLRHWIKGFENHSAGRTVEVIDDSGETVTISLFESASGKGWNVLFQDGTKATSPKVPESQERSFVAPHWSLTSRERDVLSLISAGKTNRQIAQNLEIAQRTVEKHCEHIFGKMGVENRLAAVNEWASTSQRPLVN